VLSPESKPIGASGPDRSGACSGGLKFPEACNSTALTWSSNSSLGRRSITVLPTVPLATCAPSSR
jgi:hypothetical protein